MSADNTGKQLDEMLRRALQRSSEPVPADFTQRILCRLKKDQQRKMLARIVLEEKLAIAGCIISGIAAVGLTATFPGIAVSLTNQVEIFADRIIQAPQALGDNWHFYAGFACIFGWTVYFLVELLTADITAMQKRRSNGSR